MSKCLLVLLALVTPAAQATVFCVSTGNALGTAMQTASTNGLDDEIRITMGTHISDQQAPQDYQFKLWIYSESDLDKDLIISGGWSTGNNCATQASLNPSTTILDARLWGPVFSVQYGNTNAFPYVGTFSLSNLTFNRGLAFGNTVATGLTAFGTLQAPGSVVLGNLHIVNGSGDAFSALSVSVFGLGSVRLRNSIVSLNTLTNSFSNAVHINANDGGVAYMSNNSIFSNSAGSTGAGLKALGIITLSNNAVADNTSTANPYYQFYSDAPTQLTLVKNHFGSESFVNGSPFSETDTTTGNAFWAPLGVESIPLEISPLRDSGNNSPTGGALSIDFKGGPRIVNTTIDRGASEAPAPTTPTQGPIVTDDTPVKGSTTLLWADPGETAFGEINFNVSGGDAGGLTLIECQVTSGTILIGAYPDQWVATGGTAQPVLIGFDNVSETQQTGVVFCKFTRNGIAGFTFAAYTFKSGLQTSFESGFESS